MPTRRRALFALEMSQKAAHRDGPVALRPAALSAASVAGSGASAEGAVALPQPAAPSLGRVPVPRIRIVVSPLAGRIALGSIVAAVFAVVAFATAGPSVLVPRSDQVFPAWDAGPLHALFAGLPNNVLALSYGLSAVVILMTLAYGVVLAAARTLSTRAIVISVLAIHALVLLSPPLQLTDLFNYIGYARLGALHHLNPYTHVIGAEAHDPVFRFATWHNLHSPYGPLFTAATYLLPVASLSASYWLLKVVTVLASLAFLGLLWRCAVQLGRDPRIVLALVALNPIYIVYALGGFHNDFFMLLPSMAAIVLITGQPRDEAESRWRDLGAGAVLMLAVTVKFTAVLLLPFLLLAVGSGRRRIRILAGAALGAIPLAAISVALFGLSLPNLQDQSTLLTAFSIPNVVGLALGIGGGTPLLLRFADAAVVVAVLLLLRRRSDWLSRAGWATLALIASLAWLMPWYLIWLAPLAALGASPALRRAMLALTVFLVLTFIPATGIYLSNHGLDPLGTPAGHASTVLQHKLSR
jgi:Glycosyltransferase family 87